MSKPDRDTLLRLYESMVRIRMFEERVTREFRKGDMPGFVHTYIGAEAVAVAVCAHLDDNDFISSTHRGHGHCLAKGCEPRDMLAELYGRESGLCKGRGGSMHIADFERGMLGANAIVGGGIALAAGGALASQVQGSRAVGVTFFGDGGSNQGVLHEVMNLSSIWRLPVIFVCENNGWAESTPVGYSTSVTDIADRAAGYGMPGVSVDASDIVAVYEVAGDAVERARSGDGPTLIEAKIGRMVGHYLGDPEGYRSADSKEAEQARDPIPNLESRLLDEGLLTSESIESVAAGIRSVLDEGVEYAKAAPMPDAADVESHVYAP